jgi:predicted methyltransferase
MKRLLLALSFVMLAVPFTSFAAASTNNAKSQKSLKEVVKGHQRSAAHKARDKYRHPVATLEFFGIKPTMTVVELEPGGGWYTEILAPYLKDQGHLIEAAPPLKGSSGFMHRMAQKYQKKLKSNPKVYGNVKLVPFAPPKQVKLGPANSVDMVLTFRNIHDWKAENALDSVFKAAYEVLKPGGIFGVVAHRAKPYANPAKSAKKLHRLPEDYVISLGLKTGFHLIGVSEVNANPKDPEDISVHRLPPDLDHGDTAAQKRHYKKVG